MAFVARRIAEERVALGLTQQGFADRLGISLKNVQRMEGARQNFSVRTIARVAEALETDYLALSAPTSPRVNAHRHESGDDVERIAGAGVEVFARGDPGVPDDAVPVMNLRAAAGHPGSIGRGAGVLAWARVRGRRVRPGGETLFLARVVGTSMAPRIPDGSWCLFRAPVGGKLEERILLVQHQGHDDPETGGTYTVKRIGGVEPRPDGRLRVVLESLNPSHPPRILDLDEASRIVAVAEFVRVEVAGTGRRTAGRNGGPRGR